MKPFELHAAPLQGVTLIEAGAGTGKTYTIAGLFLRLVVEKGFGVDQILVVTYTNAATEELKTRIRNRLIAAKLAFSGGKAEDEVLDHLVQHAQDKSLALQRIEDALTDFDRAAIFTIHGFCQRLLQHYAFETGQLFQSELLQDRHALVQEFVEDFWRRHISNAPYELAHFALHQLKGPDQLAKVIYYCAYPHVKVLAESDKPDLSEIARWRLEADQLLQQWAQAKDKILAILLDPGLNARFYGKCEADPRHPPFTFRQIRLAVFSAALEQWNGKYPLDEKQIRYLRSSLLKKYTKKGHDVPEHPFFAVCERALSAQKRMVQQMESYLRYLKGQLLLKARSALEEKKRRRHLLFFDDLLLQVHAALSGKQGGTLTKAVRKQYRAALVDEFQDTDLLQYGIFKGLFGRAPQSLFMIGDPKQAIYSFRGADLFSYLKAAGSAQKRTTLTKNWRSTPTLITAVNTLFENHPNPFGFQKVRFNRAVAARTDEMRDPVPLTLWYLTRTERDAPSKPFNQEDATQAVAAAVAQEIVRLLCDPLERTKPWQIAVLTRTHKQSQIIKHALTQKNVPAVLHSAGSVFNTDEAVSVGRVLSAAADPNDPNKVRAALAQDMFGLKAPQFFQSMEDPDDQWQGLWHTFHEAHRIWIRQGINPMFQTLMERRKLKARLLSLPDGERRVTNVRHLIELLHSAESQHGFAPEGLLKWLAFQMQSGQESDEQQLRLESDARAVRIITMHKSKGLQFDVVFCPFTWSGVRLDKDAAVFHDSRHHDQLTLTLGPQIPLEQQMQAQKEQLAENLRMLYVALTRAKERCYMVWGRINGSEVSAPAYLFHGTPLTLSNSDGFSSLTQKMKSITDARMIHDLKQMAVRSQGTIKIEALPQGTEIKYRPENKLEVAGSHRVLQRKIIDRWRMVSFSSLTAGLEKDEHEWPDRDLDAGHEKTPAPVSGKFDTLFDFPRGAHAGLFFHDLLEHWDHTHATASRQNALIQSKLHLHGFDSRWDRVVSRLLSRLSKKELKTSKAAFSLSQVAREHRVNEMEFYFPLKRFTSRDMQQCFADYAEQRTAPALDRQLGRLTFAPVQGFMKGYIDTVFHYRQQYYLVDWKSNFLGSRLEDYRPERLAVAMLDDFYFLQYHLYTVAVHRLLHQRIDGYRYDRDFGGVFYFFLRGVTGAASDGAGVYFDKPDHALISALDHLLIAGQKR